VRKEKKKKKRANKKRKEKEREEEDGRVDSPFTFVPGRGPTRYKCYAFV
jgi:hypothetical protein